MSEMKIVLKNEVRQFLGLSQIESNFIQLKIRHKRLFEEKYLIYTQNEIVKKLIIENYGTCPKGTYYFYKEYDFSREYRIHEKILIDCERNSEKKLSYSSIQKCVPSGIEIVIQIVENTCHLNVWLVKGTVPVFTYRTDKGFHHLQDYLDALPAHLLYKQRLNEKLTAKKAKYRPGDYFCFDRNDGKLGIGRILFNVHDLRQAGLLTGHLGSGCGSAGNFSPYFRIFGNNVYAVIYESLYNSFSEVKIEDLVSQPKTDPFLFGHYNLLNGSMKIVGHRPITSDDLHFYQFFDTTRDNNSMIHYFNWGLLYRGIDFNEELQRIMESLISTNKEHAQKPEMLSCYSPMSRICSLFSRIPFRRDCLDDVDCLFTQQGKMENQPFSLSNPANKPLVDGIFRMLGIPSDIDYDDMCKKFGLMNREELAAFLNTWGMHL